MRGGMVSVPLGAFAAGCGGRSAFKSPEGTAGKAPPIRRLPRRGEAPSPAAVGGAWGGTPRGGAPITPAKVETMKFKDCEKLLTRKFDLLVAPEKGLVWCPSAVDATQNAIFDLLGADLNVSK